ncbi:MAG: aminotransferase class V-fold PLP-dependent enzyme [Deltaproteobacteria bacterium]|nr:aminotransferase class V-fold PLP-dependent enzyme [Deltaproteobacteria bacterium]
MPPLDPQLFALDPSLLWVMHCAEGPVPRAATEAVARLLPCETRPWTLRFPDDFLGIPAAARASAAAVVGALAEDITLVPTTTSGLVTVAQGFPWEPGDEVLSPLGEFPSNAWPWRCLDRRGVTVREVPLWEGHRAAGEPSTRPDARRAGFDPEGALLAAVGPKTRVLAASWVRFQDGLVLDLERLGRGCRARGVTLVVDGIQGAGTRVPSLEACAAFATGGHKGLLAPQGLGFLWTSAELRQSLSPPGGWLGVEGSVDFTRPCTDFTRPWKRDGTRLEHGGPNLLSCAALAASLETLAAAGVGAIEAHVRGLTRGLLGALRGSAWDDEARRLLALWEAGRVGPIVALEERPGVLAEGRSRGILATAREGYLRVALHGYHAPDDVERVARWLTGG